MPPLLIALGAKIKLLSASGERSLLLSEFYTGDGAKPLSIGLGEVLVSVEVPSIPKGAFGAYFKYRIRRSIDFPLASLAALFIVDGGEKVCLEARVVIGAVGPKPEEVRGVGELLRGKRVTRSLIEEAKELGFRAARPIANVGSSPTYRRRIIKLFLEKALKQGLGESV